MLAYSSLGLPNWELYDLFALLEKFGYSGIEIALTPTHVERSGDRAFWIGVKRSAEELRITITNLHLGNPALNPDSTRAFPMLLNDDATAREEWIGKIRAAFTIAQILDCPRVTALSGPPNATLGLEGSWSRLRSGLAAALESKPRDCTLLIEHEPEHFIRTTDDLLRVNAETGGEARVNLDVGHLEVAREPIGSAIERLGGLIENVHLEDIKDRRHKHLLPGEGDIDFAEVGRALKRIGYAGPLTADLYPYADRPISALKRAKQVFGAML